MVSSRKLEIPFYGGNDQQRGKGFSARAQITGRTTIPFLCKHYVPAAKSVGADLLEFAAPENAEVVSGRKTFGVAESAGIQTLRKQLGYGSREKSASRVIPKKSEEQTNRSPIDIITNIFEYSCRTIFGTNLLWRFLEFFGEKFQLLTMSCRPTNIKLSNWSTRWKSHRFSILTDRNYQVDLRQKYLFSKLKLVKGRGYETYNTEEVEKEHKEDLKICRSKGNTKGGSIHSNSSGYLCKQQFAFIFSLFWVVHPQSANIQL